MEKLKSSLTNMVLVLVGVSLIIGALLAGVNHITAGPIAQKAEQTLATGIKQVMQSKEVKVAAPIDATQQIDGKDVHFVVHPCTDNSGKNLGAAVESVAGGFADNLKVLVGFDLTGRILGYTILESQETPGLGAKADKWFQQGSKGNIIGKSPKDGDFHVSKDDAGGNAVDAITASTITSRAFLTAVNRAYHVYAAKGMIGCNTNLSKKGI